MFVTGFSVFMIWRMVPRYGKRTPLVYISICSLVGSISVMSVKGFGVALKLTLDGNNQFTHPSTYCFAIVVIVCILVQMNYFNKALDQFSTNIVNPIYYVMFTASTIFASFLLFRGFNTAGAPAVSLLGGFIVIFVGVYLLNLNRLIDPVTQQPRVSLVTGEGLAGTGRLSEHHERLLNGDGYHANHARFSLNGRESMSQYPPGRRGDHRRGRSDSSGSVLFSAYDQEDSVGLSRLEDEDDDYREGRESPTPASKKKGHRDRTFSDSAGRYGPSNDAGMLDNDVPDHRGNHRR
jgi:multidrug transporter EmrE-like cation transporter